MKRIDTILWVVCLSLSLEGPASAQQSTTLTEPTVEYSADLIVQSIETNTSPAVSLRRRTDDPRTHSAPFNPPTARTNPPRQYITKVYKAPGKERQEEGGTIYINRSDKNVSWIVMPERKLYVEMPLKMSLLFLSPLNPTEVTKVGPEVIDGHRTMKSKVLVSNADGTLFDGFVWTTPDNIVIKTEGVSVIGENRRQTSSELKNLKVGKLDPLLFEIPEGYTDVRELLTTDQDKMDFDNQLKLMMGIFGLAPSSQP